MQNSCIIQQPMENITSRIKQEEDNRTQSNPYLSQLKGSEQYQEYCISSSKNKKSENNQKSRTVFGGLTYAEEEDYFDIESISKLEENDFGQIKSESKK